MSPAELFKIAHFCHQDLSRAKLASHEAISISGGVGTENRVIKCRWSGRKSGVQKCSAGRWTGSSEVASSEMSVSNVALNQAATAPR